VAIQRAVERFRENYGSEALVTLRAIRGPVVEAHFTGNMCYSCGLYDYFEDFAYMLEAATGSPYAVWDFTPVAGDELAFLVRLVKLTFLPELERAKQRAGPLVEARVKEFLETGRDEEAAFLELCFCLLTANYHALGGMRIQQEVGRGFLTLNQEALAARLKELGYRFPNTRAAYIVAARRLYGQLLDTLNGFLSSGEAREWLVRNVKGLGFKEASHFLRNIGHLDVAIIDRHILRFLHRHAIIEHIPSSLTPRRYLELERLLLAAARRTGLEPGVLDLYLWYLETGRVLK
jgi:N-glycosylase/DNA lyase